MIIINLVFFYICFFDYYLFDDEIMKKICVEVDQNMNCEDIVMNYVIQLIIGEFLLFVFGDLFFVNMNFLGGISMYKGYFERCSKCFDYFFDFFGCFFFLDFDGYFGFGFGRYKWDVLKVFVYFY